MKFPINPIKIGGLEILPLVEGGKESRHPMVFLQAHGLNMEE